MTAPTIELLSHCVLDWIQCLGTVTTSLRQALTVTTVHTAMHTVPLAVLALFPAQQLSCSSSLQQEG